MLRNNGRLLSGVMSVRDCQRSPRQIQAVGDSVSALRSSRPKGTVSN
jgi:hypothetical protein